MALCVTVGHSVRPTMHEENQWSHIMVVLDAGLRLREEDGLDGEPMVIPVLGRLIQIWKLVGPIRPDGGLSVNTSITSQGLQRWSRILTSQGEEGTY